MRLARRSYHCCLRERTRRWRGLAGKNTIADNASVNTVGGSLYLRAAMRGVGFHQASLRKLTLQSFGSRLPVSGLSESGRG